MEFKDSEDNQISKSSKTILVFQNRLPTQIKSSQNSLQVCRITPIWKTPSIQTKFYLYGDALISLDLSEEVQFQESLSIQNTFRPVINLKRDITSNYLRINLDNSIQGIQDFQFLIPLLQSMQNLEMYNLSKLLEEYQNLVRDDINQAKQNDPDEVFFKKQLIENYQNSLIPQILKQEFDINPMSLQLYLLLDCKYSLMDARMLEYGINDNFLQLLGTNFQTMQEFILRVGWFEATWLQDSTTFISYFTKKYLESIKINKGLDFFEDFSFRIITLDQLLLPAKFSPKSYYLLDDPKIGYTTELKSEMIDHVIGILVLINVDVEVDNIKNLLDLRNSKNTLQKNNLLFQLSEHTLSQFQYETQADYFYNKFYKNPPSKQTNSQPSLQEMFPEYTCSYRKI